MDNITAKLEFAVQMTCESCVSSVKKALSSNNEIQNVNIDLKKQLVVLDSSLTSNEVKDLIETTGKKAALVGIGGNLRTMKGTISAVSEIKCGNVKGVIRIVQLMKEFCLIEGAVDGLSKGKHGLNIHEYGDLSNGCENCGEHFNPYNYKHGSPQDKKRHLGDLGNIEADANGRAKFRMINDMVEVNTVIGRSFVIHENEDSFEQNNNGNAGKGIACAIIARSAGLFENPKRFCSCDGTTIWEDTS